MKQETDTYTRRQMNIVCVLILVLAGLWAQDAKGEALKCPRFFGSNMVLQRQKPVPLWGWATPGANVTVRFAGQEKNGTAGPDGRWAVTLDAMEANAKGQTLTVQAGNERIEMSNVLVGEVWLASGQSNMAMLLENSSMPEEELAKLERPLVRIITVKEKLSALPEADVNGSWETLNPKSAPRSSAVACYFAMTLQDQLQIPIGILSASRGGTRCETWTAAEGFDLVPELKEQADEVRALHAKAIQATQSSKSAKAPKIHPKGTPAANYNAMIHPMLGTALRGAIWYQGESNTGDGLVYEKKMQALVGGWRALWKQGNFPFYFVQLAPWNRHRALNLGLIWEAQLRASRSIPNSGMVVTTDIGDINDVHAKNKKDVGERLALWALAKDYPETKLTGDLLGKSKTGKAADLVFSGPLYTGYKIKDNKVIISFEHAESGLTIKGEGLRNITIMGEGDKKFVPAVATIDGSTLVVTHPDGKAPLHVRMGWEPSAQPNLANKEGLPASPFRTDKLSQKLR